MAEVLFFALFIIASFAIGSALLGKMGIRFRSFAEEFAFSTAAGYGIIILITYALGFFGLLYRGIYLVLILAAIIVGMGRIRHLLSQLPGLFNEAFSLIKSALKLNVFSVLLLLVLFFLAFNFVASLAPPWSYDTTVYHLAAPKIYAAQHGFVYLPTMLHSNWVMSSHMLFLASVVVSGGKLASLVNFSFAALLAIAIFSFGSRFLDRKTAVLAAAAFITLPIVNVFSVSANNDLSLAFFAFMAFYAFIAWASERKLWWLGISAFFTGIAASTKLTGVAIIPLMAGLFLIHAVFVQKSWKNNAIPIAAFGAIAVTVAFPAFLKNIVYAGNPFYPLFSGIFGGNYLSREMIDSFVGAVRAYGTGVSLQSALFLPWNLTMYPLKFIEQLGITPLFLAFMPLLLFIRKNPVIKFTLAAGFLYLAVWFFTSQALRYAIYIFPFFSIASAFAISSISSQLGKKQYFLVGAVVAAVFLFSTALLFGANLKQVPVALGMESEDQFFAKLGDGNIYAACKYANENLPEDALIILVYENRGYHCDRNYLVAVPPDQSYIYFTKLTSPEAVAYKLEQVGVTNVIVNNKSPIYKPGGYAFPPEISMNIEGFLLDYGEVIHSTPNADIYAITYT